MNVRSAGPADVDGALAWLTELVDDGTGHHVAGLRDRDAHGDNLRLAEEGGTPIALVVVERRDGEVRFPLVAVRREARGRGVAAKMLVAIEEGERASRYIGELANNDGRALYFWLRLGYRPKLATDGRVIMERVPGVTA